MKKRNLAVLIGILIFLPAGYATAQATLLYSNSFDTTEALNDWTMEGPGVAKVENGKLSIHSKWQPELEKIKDQVPLIEPGADKYYPFIERWVKQREPERIADYLKKTVEPGTSVKPGTFAGGHIQFWNKRVHPKDFLIRLKFQPTSPYPLHMVTFCGRGLNGEDILDPKLAPRFGLGAQYMKGDIQNYRISYWSGERATCNMRRAPGRQLAAEETGDVPRGALDKEVQLEIFRFNGRVVFKCDGETLVDWTDDKPFDDGFFSLRLMAAAKGLYDDYEVYEMLDDPFNYTGQGEKISSRLSAQKDRPKPEEVIDGKYIVVGSGESKTSLYRDVINTYKGHPVYHFAATPEANRIELTTCYATNVDDLTKERQTELSAINNLYLNNDQGSYGDTITYDWHARFPKKLKNDAQGIFAQWHGRPDRTLVETPAGELKKLSAKDFLELLKTMEFDNELGNIGIDRKTGKPNGWKSDGSAGGPIAAFKFQDEHMCLLVRSDPNPRSDNTIRIKPKPGGIRPTQREGNKTGAIAFELPIADVPINQWIHFKVQIKYSSYSIDSDKPLTSGFVKVWIDEKQVANWQGDIGKNDEKGPYFKYGIYKPGADGFEVDCAGFTQTIDNEARTK